MNADALSCTTHHHGPTAAERRRPVDVGSSIRRILDALVLWHQRRRQHAILARLNDRLLDDVGLHREDLMFTTRDPFWRL